jgi:hypothetical protein
MALAQPAAKKDDDREDDAEYSPFYGIEKGAVLQEARVFNDSQLDARRCAQVCGIARFLKTYFFFICQDSAAF